MKFDATSDAFVQPEQVSPWNIEPVEPIKKKHTSLQHQPKRPRPLDALLPGFRSVVKDGQFLFIICVGLHSLLKVSPNLVKIGNLFCDWYCNLCSN